MAVSFNWNHHGLLDRWQIRMHESPWVFNQFSQADLPAKHKVRTNRARGEVYSQSQREDIAAALHNSFEQVTDILGYYPQPTYTEKEVIRFSRSDVRSGDPLFWRGAFDDPTRYRTQKRKLIRFGNKVLTEVPQRSGQTNYEVNSKNLSSGIPGYEIRVFLNQYSPEDPPFLNIVKGEYYFSLKNFGFSTLDDKQRFRLSEYNPRIQRLGGGQINYDYLVDIPAWELVNLNHRFNDFLSSGDDALEYSDDGRNYRQDFEEFSQEKFMDVPADADPQNNPPDPGPGDPGYVYDEVDDEDVYDWDEDGPVVDDSQIVVSRITYESTGAVNLLTHPEVTGTANVIRTPVEAYIIDAEEGSFGLRGNYTLTRPPFAVEVSHISGLERQTNGLMHPGIEQAIICLTNAELKIPMPPLSFDSAALWTKDREEIVKKDGVSQIAGNNINIYNSPSEILNPLGVKYGHASAWGMLRHLADPIRSKILSYQ